MSHERIIPDKRRNSSFEKNLREKQASKNANARSQSCREIRNTTDHK